MPTEESKMPDVFERFDRALVLIAELDEELKYFSGAIDENNADELHSKIDAATLKRLGFIGRWCSYARECAGVTALKNEVKRAFSKEPEERKRIIDEFRETAKGLGLESQFRLLAPILDLE